jgi:hypothetical protein
MVKAMDNPSCSRGFCFFILVLLTGLLFGCAPLEKRVPLTYQRAGGASGGTGEVYLLRPVLEQQLPKMPGGRAVLGVVKDSDTQIVAAEDVSQWVMNALMQELYSAGYEVRTALQLPADAPKGVRVRVQSVSSNQTSDGLILTTSTDIKLAADIFRAGQLTKTLTVATGSQDQGLDRSAEFVAESLQKTLQSAMQQLIPGIVNALEG